MRVCFWMPRHGSMEMLRNEGLQKENKKRVVAGPMKKRMTSRELKVGFMSRQRIKHKLINGGK
jgi:hypothetical protein